MINKLYVFANMGHLDQLPKSGGQTSARRVMKGFQEEGFEIVPIRRHRAEQQSKIGHILEVGFFAFFDWFKMIAKMALSRRKNAAFLQMTYAGELVPYEYLLSITARLMGYRCIEYLQGGKMMDTYPSGTALHKSLYKKNMELQDAVLFEGYDALKLTEDVTTKPLLVYFPSYIVDNQIPNVMEPKSRNSWNICFFGRIAKQKNILIIIEAFNILSSRLTDEMTHLTLIGGSDSDDYLKEVQHAIEKSPYKNRIELFGISPYEFIKDKMVNQHFYVFPTITRAEGHSNALNEAMSYGLVPIVSNLHFNASVVGNKDFVVDGYAPQSYADRMFELIKTGNMDKYSNEVWLRVKNLYAYSKVNKEVANSIKSLGGI